MREFDKPIGRVWRRMRAQRFLAALVWSLGATLLAAAIAFGLDKLPTIAVPGPEWAPFAIAGGVGLLIAAGIALLTGPSRLDAAIAIDRAFQLNDRLGTVLSLPADLHETPAGRALIQDTRQRMADLDVRARFGLRPPRWAWVPLVPALLTLGLWFMPNWVAKRAQADELLAQVDPEKLAEQARILNKKLAENRAKLDPEEFAESARLLAEIEKAADDLAKAPPADREKALVELNKLTDALKERQKQVGDSEQISKKLEQLKEMSSQGPADEFAKDLAKGDFEKAAEEVQKLKEKLMSGQMSQEEKDQLKQQLMEMKEQLVKLANLEERKKQLEEAKQSGQISQEQFDQQMAKLNDQAEDLEKLKQLADRLAEAGQQMDQGQMQKAAEALGMSQEQLEQMASELAELESLDAAMADLQQAKDGMVDGEGLNQMGERLGGMGGFGDGMNNNGQGLGRGRGQGDRPIAADDTNAYNTRVAQQLGRGKAIQEGFGPPNAQTVGESIIESQATIEAAAGVQAEALSNQKVPANVKKHVLSYFDEFRDEP